MSNDKGAAHRCQESAGSDDGNDGNDGVDGVDAVGSVGEEAAKLFGALADAARHNGHDLGDSLGGFADQAAAFAHDINDHVASDALECRYCPVCRVVHAVRKSSPEVRDHLTSAAASLMQAAAGLLETMTPSDAPAPPAEKGSAAPRRGPEVERIPLDRDEQVDPSDQEGRS